MPKDALIQEHIGKMKIGDQPFLPREMKKKSKEEDDLDSSATLKITRQNGIKRVIRMEVWRHKGYCT